MERALEPLPGEVICVVKGGDLGALQALELNSHHGCGTAALVQFANEELRDLLFSPALALIADSPGHWLPRRRLTDTRLPSGRGGVRICIISFRTFTREGIGWSYTGRQLVQRAACLIVYLRGHQS